MTWTAPMTAVANTVFTAAQFNTHIRDNLNETAPAKATAAGTLFVGAGVNSIAERVPSTNAVTTSESTGSTSYTDVTTPGPAVTVTTGTKAIVIVTSLVQNSTSGQNAYASYAVSGASAISATDDRAVLITAAATNQTLRASSAYMETGLTAGSNTFTMKYRVTGGTGSFQNRRITVIPL
jgi:hypothetical protein